jgi:hypothetical protein
MMGGKQMAKGRVFPKKIVKQKAEDNFGSSRFIWASPDLVSQGTKSLNLEISFEEGLKLLIALQTCLQELTRYDRRTLEGKAMGLMLSIKLDNKSVSVLEKQIHKEK